MNPDALAAKYLAALNPTANLLLVAMAQEQTLREEVDAIKARLLTEDVYTDEFSGERITDPDLDYCMASGARSDGYSAKLSAACKAVDLEDDEGLCEALKARSVRLKAEAVLIDLASTVPGGPLQGITSKRVVMVDARKKLVELLMGMVVNHPNYVPITA